MKHFLGRPFLFCSSSDASRPFGPIFRISDPDDALLACCLDHGSSCNVTMHHASRGFDTSITAIGRPVIIGGRRGLDDLTTCTEACKALALQSAEPDIYAVRPSCEPIHELKWHALDWLWALVLVRKITEDIMKTSPLTMLK